MQQNYKVYRSASEVLDGVSNGEWVTDYVVLISTYLPYIYKNYQVTNKHVTLMVSQSQAFCTI